MTTVVPAVRPFTTPVPELTDALVGTLLLHAPPPGVVFNVVVFPIHTAAVPPMADGVLLTVTVVVCLHPVASW